MITFTFDLRTDCSVGDAFALITNFERRPEYLPILEIKQTSQGAMGVGTTYDQVAKMMGRDTITSTEVTGYETNKKFRYKGVAGPLQFDEEYTFEAADSGSWLNIVVQGKLSGLLRLMEPFAKPKFRKELEKNRDNIQKALDAEAVAHA